MGFLYIPLDNISDMLIFTGFPVNVMSHCHRVLSWFTGALVQILVSGWLTYSLRCQLMQQLWREGLVVLEVSGLVFINHPVDVSVRLKPMLSNLWLELWVRYDSISVLSHKSLYFLILFLRSFLNGSWLMCSSGESNWCRLGWSSVRSIIFKTSRLVHLQIIFTY